MPGKKAAFNVIVIAISIALAAYLLSLVGAGDLVRILSSIRLAYLIPCALLYAASNLFKSMRLRVLIGERLPITRLFSISAAHNLFNQFMPARSGELSLIIMLRRYEGIKTGRGIAVLLMARVFDFLALAALFCLAVLSAGALVPGLLSGVLAVTAFVSVITAALLLLVFRGRLFLSLLGKAMDATGLARFRFAKYLFRKASETVDAFGSMRLRKTIPASAGLTAVIWACMFLSYLLLVGAFGLQIGPGQTMVLTFVMMSLPLLPVYGAGGFGTTEAAVAIVLMAYGFPQAQAVAAGFGMHIILLLLIVAIGLLGLATVGRGRGRPTDHDSPA